MPVIAGLSALVGVDPSTPDNIPYRGSGHVLDALALYERLKGWWDGDCCALASPVASRNPAAKFSSGIVFRAQNVGRRWASIEAPANMQSAAVPRSPAAIS
jgi:hypothetical protein